MRLLPELVEELNKLKACGVLETEPVFKSIPRIDRFRRDLIKAGIAPKDANDRKAVFHSLRHTFGTNLARGDVASRVAMSLMRHSDRRLTDKIYTDENLLGTWAAFDALPNYSERASQILGAEGQNVTLPVAMNGENKTEQTVEIANGSNVLTLPDATCYEKENGGSGGARTCVKANVHKGETAAPSQIASQAPFSTGQDLTRVVATWAKLPAAFKAAILAIVNSSGEIK